MISSAFDNGFLDLSLLPKFTLYRPLPRAEEPNGSLAAKERGKIARFTMKERQNLPAENTYLIVLFKHSLFY